MAMAGGTILIFLYGVMLFAEFIAPYRYDSEESTAHSYHPPSKLRFRDIEGKFHLRPFVYSSFYKFDENQRRFFFIRPIDDEELAEYPDKLQLNNAEKEQLKVKHKLCLFPKGEKYKLWGLIPMERHLFGVEGEGRIYLFGADSLGRDLFSRIVYGSRVSLTIGIVGVLITTLLGLLIGGISGYFGGITDTLLMRLCEIIMLFPAFYLLLGLRGIFPLELSSIQVYYMIVLILSFIGWAGLARVIRGMAKATRELEFVQAAEAIGQKRLVIIFRHILPQSYSYLIVSLTLTIPAYILSESSLSLIGLGIQEPHASWGNLLTDAMNISALNLHPWLLTPGVFIFITVMAYNLLGDGLRDILDPKSTKR